MSNLKSTARYLRYVASSLAAVAFAGHIQTGGFN
jgi:hypothetical protein